VKEQAAWPRVTGSGIHRERDIVLQTLDMVVPGKEGAYLAAPISTGRRFFEALGEHSVAGFDELLNAIGEETYLQTVRWPNVADGEHIANQLRARGVPHVINTGTLLMDTWCGHDYMDLCFALIRKKVRAVYFHPEWAYSSGAVKEFLFCMQNGLPRLQIDGRPLDAADGRAALERVCERLRELSLSPAEFEASLLELEEISK
jgi:hypothetical protein